MRQAAESRKQKAESRKVCLVCAVVSLFLYERLSGKLNTRRNDWKGEQRWKNENRVAYCT